MLNWSREKVFSWGLGEMGLDPSNHRPHLVFTLSWFAVQLLQFSNCFSSQFKTCLGTFSNGSVPQANFACCCCSQLPASMRTAAVSWSALSSVLYCSVQKRQTVSKQSAWQRRLAMWCKSLLAACALMLLQSAACCTLCCCSQQPVALCTLLVCCSCSQRSSSVLLLQPAQY